MRAFVDRVSGVGFRDRGRDYDGLDCWGLIWLAYRDVLGIDLPCFEDVPALQKWQADNLYDVVRRKHIEIDLGQERPGDVIVLRGTPVHVGLVVERGLMLHIRRDTEACVESYSGIDWRFKVVGIYRYKPAGQD